MALSLGSFLLLSPLSMSVIVGGLLAGLLAYAIGTVVYNLHFHPLAGFPGPWWMGASDLAEMYFDLILGGRYFKQVEAMHKRYGPMVRVNPNELHFNDPSFYDQIYGKIGQPRNLDYKRVRLSASPTSIVATADHEQHRIRRAPLNTCFSKRSILQLEPFIKRDVDKLVAKLKVAYQEGTVFETLDAFGAITTDIISQHAYGESFGCLDQPGFKNKLMRHISGLFLAGPFVKHLPVIARILNSLPPRVLVLLNKGIASTVDLKRKSATRANQALESCKANRESENKPRTIFQALLDPSMPPEERTHARLTDEGVVVIAAGIETTARALTDLVCHLLLNPSILSTLRCELKSFMGTREELPSWTELEQLPYFSVVIQEGLRLNKALTFRAPRTILDPLVYNDCVIPAGTTIGSMAWLMNIHPDTFGPDPEVFRPERWIEARERGENLGKYLCSFTKGSRMCLGINLAYAELYLMLAAVVNRFDLELVDSGKEDITPYRDYTMGFTKEYRYGIKVRITRVLEN